MLTVSDITPEVLSNNDVPSWAVAFVELLLDLSSNILLDVVLFQSGRGNVNGLLLHLLRHVNVLDDGLRVYADFLRAGVVGRSRVHFFGHGELRVDCDRIENPVRRASKVIDKLQKITLAVLVGWDDGGRVDGKNAR